MVATCIPSRTGSPFTDPFSEEMRLAAHSPQVRHFREPSAGRSVSLWGLSMSFLRLFSHAIAIAQGRQSEKWG